MGLSYQKPIVVANKDPQPLRVFMCGLYSTGKTTIINVIKYGTNVETTITIGIGVEKITINDINLLVIDEGGRSRARVFHSFRYRGTSGMIVVIDSADRENIDNLRYELFNIFDEVECQNRSLLVFANKQDLPNAMSLGEIKDRLNLSKLNKNIKWHLQPACAIRNEGLHEGFQWLANSLVEKINPIKPIHETMSDLTKLNNRLMSFWNITNFKTLWGKLL
ncbi:unnamed protein product [Rotaria magnacalcarata]|uniref:ADP-ribosylation factor-like protein 6 n=1 Tax=Rotaria magnacalcarata TaxID=392030 RepID=A0A816CQH1_9BILA|nr:unnamed protein product [Rotaria magnacalcarata]CAF1627391.1 unnamed protein product [Rotaria magnacalcarata]CAF2035015.1 unnamed protein product [Rotaria magnacalcarata]CAF2066399.1 unnamed protein product [Rotaria magnacalcarata]CAF2227407.1 unnamed protein product [Rotaria magnacalcarata]